MRLFVHFKKLNHHGIPEDSVSLEDGVMNKQARYSPEVRERAVRLVFEHQTGYPSQWAAKNSIAGKAGCMAETLRKCVGQAGRDQGLCAGLTSEEFERVKALEPEKPSAEADHRVFVQGIGFFVQAELDRRPW